MRLLRAHTASQAVLWPWRPYAPLFFIGALPQNTPELRFTTYAKFIWVPWNPQLAQTFVDPPQPLPWNPP